MANIHSDEFDQRLLKMRTLREQGTEPYPSEAHRTITVRDFLSNFSQHEESAKEETVAGRVRLLRGHGGVLFAQLEDNSGMIQIVCSKKDIGDEQFAFMNASIDVGDIIEVRGTAFVTKKGEQSILASHIGMLSKALKPLPDKWLGIQDEETRFRKRYLDMIMNPALREMFVKKAKFWNSMRQFLIDEGFLEVETPVLESTAGGADAEPFTTHHNALDIDLYLRISMGELWQKRLMVAGFEKTFEIGRQFRNEGVSPEHLQDYTQMEFYWAYANYKDTMKLVERMYKHCIMQAFGTLQFSIRGFDINFDQEWVHIDYASEIQRTTGVDITTASLSELLEACTKLELAVPAGENRGRVIDTLWKYCRKSIAGPVFLMNHPVDVSPLAKRSAENPALVERYQIIIAGSEQGNGYTELNDPIDQEERFAEQARLREQGDVEAQMHDEDFIEALRYGMPPTSGFGVSERLFSFLVDKPIRECVLFPLLRPKQAVLPADTSSEPEIASETDDVTMGEFDAGMSHEEAKAWMFEHVHDENLRKHMLATDFLMRNVAAHLGVPSQEAWGIAGLLHDIDYEECDAKEHSIVGAQMLADRGMHPAIIDAVREHNPAHGIEPKTALSKALMSLEQLTGLVLAATAVQPDKSVHSVKAKSVKKKFKDKAFAKGVIREYVHEAEPLLGIPLETAIELCLKAMQDNAEDIGLL